MTVNTLERQDPARVGAGTRWVSVDPTDAAFFQNPYPAFEAMRAAGPAVFWEQLGRWCLTGYDDVNAVLRDKRFGREILHIATREEVGIADPPGHVRPFYEIDDLSMLSREPPVHTRLRALVNRAFVSRQIEKLRPRVATLANELIDRFPKGTARTPSPERGGSGRGPNAPATGVGPPPDLLAGGGVTPLSAADLGSSQAALDLIAAFATPIPVTIIAELLGVPVEAAPDLLDWSHRMVAMYRTGRTRADEDSAVAATHAFVAFLRDYVGKRRKAPRDDLISHLISAEAAGEKLSEDELISGCILLLNAGHEATVHALGNAVKAILESGLDPAELFAGEETTAATVEETLRFDPPLHFFDRFALEPVEVAGVKLGKGEKIGLLLGAANRDPARWQDAGRFDPARPLLPHVAFGAGIHFCIGAPLARLELEVALPILFARLPGLKLAASPRYRNAWHFHGLEALPVSY